MPFSNFFFGAFLMDDLSPWLAYNPFRVGFFFFSGESIHASLVWSVVLGV